MAENINYKDYLAQLGAVETDQAARIKKYLEEQTQHDEALKALYRPEKIDDCYDFIMNAVKEMPRKGSCACIEDGVVFKMARDYFIEILPKAADEPPEVKSSGAETAEKATMDNTGPKAEPENENPAEKAVLHPADETEGKESAESENSEAETELSTATDSQQSDQKEEDNENETVTDEYGFEVFGEDGVRQTAERNVSEAAAACGRHGAETAEKAGLEAETELSAATDSQQSDQKEADNGNSGQAEPENEKPEKEAPCHQDEVGKDTEDLVAGCRFDTGVIIDRPGRRLMFKDLFRGLHFVHADDDKSHLYLVVCEVTYIDDERIRFRIGNDDFGCSKRDIDGERWQCDRWLYSIPSDGKAVGKLVDDVRTELAEDVQVPSYDSEGNGLLFGF